MFLRGLCPLTPTRGLSPLDPNSENRKAVFGSSGCRGPCPLPGSKGGALGGEWGGAPSTQDGKRVIPMIKVRLLRSKIGCNPHQRKVLAALGLTRIRMEKSFEDNAAVRGMINKVKHMVEVVQ